MSDENKYAWRITNHSTGEIVEIEPSYKSTDEALQAARKYAFREFEAEHEITVVILDEGNQIVSETNVVAHYKSAKKSRPTKSNGANLGFEEKMWRAAAPARYGHLHEA